MVSRYISAPPPRDLTRYIRKISDQHFAGGSFGDVYRCQYFGGPTVQEVRAPFRVHVACCSPIT